MDEEPRSRRGRPKTLDADKTLNVAMEAYWRSDPADVSINRICELAGVSKPALYREFGGEDGLMRAVLDLYAGQVLSEIFGLLDPDRPLSGMLAGLIRFAAEDPKMQTGCVFYKMRAGKHRLGPQTRARVDELDAGAVAGFAAYLGARRAAGDWDGAQTEEAMARYLVEQVGLALMQRAAGEDVAQVRETMVLALSVLGRGAPGFA